MKNLAYRKFQRGSALVVSLIVLLILTIIGITSVGTSTLEEKMAGNSRDQNLAFQSAEVALRDAEQFLTGIASTAGFTGNGLYATGTAPDVLASTTWTTNGTASIAVSNANSVATATTQPRYIIEYIGASTPTSNKELNGGYGDSSGQGTVSYFRITARGTGGTDNSAVLIQEEYGKIL